MRWRLGVPPGFDLLREPDYRRIWLAHSGSVAGDGLYGVALTWLTYSTIGAGAHGLAALGVALLVPNLTLGVLTGTLVDRWDRRRVMVAADLVRAGVMAALAIFVALGFTNLPVILAAGVVLTTASLFFNPARHAVLPAYVRADDLVPANALLATMTQASSLITPALGAILFAGIGPISLLLLNGLSFVWSAFFIRGLNPGPALPGPAPHRPLIQEAADGLRFLGTHPPSRLVVLAAAGNQLFASGPWRVMVPAWVSLVLGGGVVEYGVLLSALSAGLLIANVTMSAVKARLPLVAIIVGGIFFDGLAFLVFAYTPTLFLAGVMFFALGVSNGVLNAANTARLQLTVPTEMRGRVFATFGTVMNLTAPISLAVTGTLAATAGPVALITASGVGLMAVGAVGFIAAIGQLRREAAVTTAA
jgi:MFS family permease